MEHGTWYSTTTGVSLLHRSSRPHKAGELVCLVSTLPVNMYLPNRADPSLMLMGDDEAWTSSTVSSDRLFCTLLEQWTLELGSGTGLSGVSGMLIDLAVRMRGAVPDRGIGVLARAFGVAPAPVPAAFFSGRTVGVWSRQPKRRHGLNAGRGLTLAPPKAYLSLQSLAIILALLALSSS